MDGTSIIVMCFVIEGYLISVMIALVFEEYCYCKDGNKKGTNLKGRALRIAISHELVHARIANKFGFTDWKIIRKPNSLACRIYFDYDVLSWGLLFSFLRMCGVHFVFDVCRCVIWVDVTGICEYIKEYSLGTRRIIGKFIKLKKV